jgi:hypothetical protein
MAKLTPQQAAEKQARRLKGATEDIRLGVDRVTEAPGKKAAAKQDKMRQRINESIDSGIWATRVAAVPLEEWKAQMKDKGIPRISSGIDGAKAKVTDFFGKLFPYQDTIKAELERMPDLTLEDSINRATHQMRRMAQFRK